MTDAATPLVSGRDLHKSFGRTAALRGASLDVAPGEIVAVTGPSGSGKSTLLHCLAGVIAPDAGTVTYRDHRLSDLSAAARTRLRRQEVGLVLQLGQLVPELTALENVALPLLLDRRRRAEAQAVALERLDRLGVADVAQARPGEMSGGQAQRVAIARALVTEPAIVLADEPTGALDTVAGEQALAALVGAVRENGAALVLVTHDNRVAAVAHREVELRDGRTDAVGVPR
ncbi:ABC transporter ATP-binding protein [Nocardioides deserti]|uniref:ABC transporter ATP-binding protein n=1 Tax=Nocardioides deserti TaxID=1588644 RepID=A0ABR6UC31_9ACTN|nr:ABC transporter ATP-binding protein [Nocardioides deserti]MBC2962002.1 ABC transporter ATP-binding protein [Nocardioides deserti]GGO70581.1 ABC transporter ATP-binding protein [Nocardioides deserti]